MPAGLPIYAATFNLNFTGSVGGDTVAYTGDQNNLFSVACGTISGNAGYNYCQGEIDGDLLPGPTRASVTSPSMPYFTSSGYQADFVNAQNQIVAILQINPSGGCLDSGGATVTCGVAAILLSSLTGGALSNSVVSSFSNIPVSGTFTVTGANQTAILLDWSNGRVDDLNAQITGQSAPEPATIGFVGAALFPLWLIRRRNRKA